MDVIVPASVANLGGGFDTLAVAVQLYLRVRILDVRDDGGGVLKVVASNPPVAGENAVERAFGSLARQTKRRAPSVFVEVDSDIPMAAGLGSSAAATVAGLRVFERVAGPVPEARLLAVATAAEGHADNAAAAIYGGLTSVLQRIERAPVHVGKYAGQRGALPMGLGLGHDERPGPAEPAVPRRETFALRWNWPDELRIVVATPLAGLATAKARACLPESVSREDAVFNLQRVLSFVHALQHGEYERLREAVQDRWHQPARMALVPQLGEALAIDDPDVLGVFLSGAGPSVALLAHHDVERVERLLHAIYERAGCPATIRTLSVHQSSEVLPDAMVSVHGRTV